MSVSRATDREAALPEPLPRPPPLRPPLLPVLVAVCLCVASVNVWPLWGDEIWTWALVDLSFGEMLAKVRQDVHPPGYFTLVWGLVGTASPDWVLRLPSLLGAVGAVAAAGAVGRRWLGEVEGHVAAYALALSPFLIVYAGIARGYALLACVAALLLLAATELVAGTRVRAAGVGLAVAGTAALYVHYAAAAAVVSVGIGVGLGLLARPDRGRGRWGWALGAPLVTGLLFAPWALGTMRDQALDHNETAASLRALGFLGWPVGPYTPAANWVILAVAGVGVVRLARRRTATDVLLLGVTACALAIPLALSTRGYIQSKFYVQSWFLPVWALLVGVGAAALLSRLAPRRAGGATIAAGILAVLAAAPLATLARLPSGPFGLKKGNTAYDVRVDVRLFDAVLPASAPPATPMGGDFLYQRYGEGVMTRLDANGWRHQRRNDERTIRSLADSLDAGPCEFEHAFLETLLVPDPAQCAALLGHVQAVADDDAYPPFLLELAANARSEGRYVDAERLGRAAAAVGARVGWSGPAVFLAQFYAQNGDYDGALAALDEALAIAVAWDNRYAGQEIYGLRGEALRYAGRLDEAGIAERCSVGNGNALPCPAEQPQAQ